MNAQHLAASINNTIIEPSTADIVKVVKSYSNGDFKNFRKEFYNSFLHEKLFNAKLAGIIDYQDPTQDSTLPGMQHTGNGTIENIVVTTPDAESYLLRCAHGPIGTNTDAYEKMASGLHRQMNSEVSGVLLALSFRDNNKHFRGIMERKNEDIGMIALPYDNNQLLRFYENGN